MKTKSPKLNQAIYEYIIKQPAWIIEAIAKRTYEPGKTIHNKEMLVAQAIVAMGND